MNNSYYTGIAIDPVKRWAEHQQGSASKYTRSFPPKNMVALWKLDGERGFAQKIEWQIKSLSRLKKQRLITKPNSLVQVVSGIDGLEDSIELGNIASLQLSS